MTKKTLIIGISGFTVSFIVSGIVYFNLFLETYDLFGYEDIKNPEERHAKIFYTSLVTTVVIALTAFVFDRLQWKDFASGFALPTIIGIFPMASVGPTYFIKSNYYEEFNQERWLAEKKDRVKMARQLVRTNELAGLKREEVIRKLGSDFFVNEEMNYTVIEDFCMLGIRFDENERVKDYGIWLWD